MSQSANRNQTQLEGEAGPEEQNLGGETEENRRRFVVGKVREGGGNKDEVTDAKAGLREDDHDVDGEAAQWAADGKAQVTEGGDSGEARYGVDFAAREDEEHHTLVGEEGDGEEHEEAHEPARSLEGVGQAQHAGPNYGDEDVGEGLQIGGQRRCLSQQRSVLRRVRWKGVRRRPCFLGEHHGFFLLLSTSQFSVLNYCYKGLLIL